MSSLVINVADPCLQQGRLYALDQKGKHEQVTIQVNTSVDAELQIGTASRYITSRLLLPECSILPAKKPIERGVSPRTDYYNDWPIFQSPLWAGCGHLTLSIGHSGQAESPERQQCADSNLCKILVVSRQRTFKPSAAKAG